MKTEDELLDMATDMNNEMESVYADSVAVLVKHEGCVPPLFDLNRLITRLSSVLDKIEEIIDESSGNPLPSFMIITSTATLVKSRMITLRSRLSNLKCQLN